MTWRTSSGGIDSRSTVYFGFCFSNLSTSPCASLSRAAVSAVPTNILITSPCPDPPPQPAVPKSAAPASPAPPSFKKSLRLTAFLRLVTMCLPFAVAFTSRSRLPKTLFCVLRFLQHPLHRQDARPRHARLLIQIAQHDREVAGSKRQRTAVDGAPDLGQKRVADVRHASPHHDKGGVERADEGGQHLSHEPPRLPYDLERVVVPEGGGLADVPRGERTALVEDLPEDGGEAFLRAPLRFGGDCRSGGHRFEAPPVAARANRPVRVHADVPYVPSAPLAAALQMPVRDDAAADAGADLDEEHVVFALADAVPVLAQRHHVHVVVHEDRGIVLVGERRAYGKPVPTRHDRRAPQNPRGALHGARNPHTYGHYVPRISPLLCEQLRKQLLDPVEHLVRTVLDVSMLTAMHQDLAAEGGQGDVSGGGAEVHGGYQASRTGDAQEGGAPSSLRLGQAILGEQAGPDQPPHLHGDLAPADAQHIRHLGSRHRTVRSPYVMHNLRLNAVLDKQTPAISCLGYTVFTPHKHSIDKLPPCVYRLMTRRVISRRT